MAQPAQRRPTKKINIDIDEPSTSGPKKKLRPGVLIAVAAVAIPLLIIILVIRNRNTDIPQNLDTTGFIRMMTQQQIFSEVKSYVQANGQFPSALSDLPLGKDPGSADFLASFQIRELNNDRFIVQWIDPSGQDQLSASTISDLRRADSPGWHNFGDNVVVLVFYAQPSPPPPMDSIMPNLPPPPQ